MEAGVSGENMRFTLKDILTEARERWQRESVRRGGGEGGEEGGGY